MLRPVIIGAVFLMFQTTVASAQGQTGTGGIGIEFHKAELVPMGGYSFTSAFEVYTGVTYGEIDLADAAYYGLALDVNVMKPGATKTGQLRLMYRRSDTELRFTSGGLFQPVTMDAAVEYWHIGGLAGIPRGTTFPYMAVTLGGTRLVVEDEDTWKFSTMLGLGVKKYINPKVGLMFQGNWAFTFIETWGSVSIGTGGAGVGLSGTGVSQWDIGGGLIICF